MSKISLAIKGTQIIDGTPDITEFVTAGEMISKDGIITFHYIDSVSLGIENVETDITVKKDTVTIVRGKGKFGCLTIQKNERHICPYYTPYGEFTIGIYGDKVSNTVHTNGKLYLEYTIDLNSSLMSKNMVEITVREEK